mgnify:CR=1 FL=1
MIITLHVVTSLDGYLARADNSVSWLESPEGVYKPGLALADVDHEAVVAGIDAYVVGSHTYEHALELGWPYGDTPVIVVTRRDLPPHPHVEFFAGDLGELVSDVLAPRFASVWLVGGARLCGAFLEQRLVDRMVLTVAPVLLGAGLRMFASGRPEQRWRLTDVTAFDTGFVELSYALAVDEGAAFGATQTASRVPLSEAWLFAAESVFAREAGNTVSAQDHAAIDAAGLGDVEAAALARRVVQAVEDGGLSERERSAAYFALSKCYEPRLIPRFRVWLAREVADGGPVFQLMIALDTLEEPVFGADRDGYASRDVERNLVDARRYLAELGS